MIFVPGQTAGIRTVYYVLTECCQAIRSRPGKETLIHQVDLLLVSPTCLVLVLHEIDLQVGLVLVFHEVYLLLCLVFIFGKEPLPVVFPGLVFIFYLENLQVGLVLVLHHINLYIRLVLVPDAEDLLCLCRQGKGDQYQGDCNFQSAHDSLLFMLRYRHPAVVGHNNNVLGIVNFQAVDVSV